MGLYQILTSPQNFKFYAEKSFPNVNAVSTATSFGQKSIGYGDSNQPYIKIPFAGSGQSFSKLNDPTKDGPWFLKEFGNLPTSLISAIGNQFSTGFDITSDSSLRYNSKSWGPDFLTRGNGFGFIRTSDDVLRLTKYFTDDRSPSSNLFTAKQNILSRISPRTEASYGLTYGLGTLNGGVYTPLSTIAQAGLSLLEGHVYKQGLDPFNTIPGSGIRKYETAIFDNQLAEKNSNNNRLIKLSKLSYITVSEADALNKTGTYNISPNTNYFLSYGGGPGSFLGIGKTKLNYATDNAGQVPLITLSKKEDFSSVNNTSFTKPLTWDRKDLAQVSSSLANGYSQVLEDFRKPLLDVASPEQQSFLSISPSYKLDAIDAEGKSTSGNIEKRTNFKGAGVRGNLRNFQAGKKSITPGTTAGKVLGPTDLINAFPIYQGESPSTNDLLKDMIDFRIGIYDNDTIGPGNIIKLNWMHFRVLLDDFSDSYGADWKAINYMGRAENFYKYDSFKRDISIAFTVAAQSKQELLPIYKKLNYLASSLAPSYSANGFIRGNLSQITLGNWLFEQPGFISSVDLSIPDDSPWEINLPLDGKIDDQVKQVPHMVNVKIKFTPIHKFRPEINKVSDFFMERAVSEDNILTTNPKYGPQRYIALEDKKSNAYDNQLPFEALPPTRAGVLTARSVNQQNELPISPVSTTEGVNTTYYDVNRSSGQR
jgi:hypothetical protein